MKYRGGRAAAPELGRLLAQHMAKHAVPGEVIVAVPLHHRRLRARGYNQSALLARELSKLTAVPQASNLLTRFKDAPPQVEAASRSQRRTNVDGSFQASSNVAGLKILLTDIPQIEPPFLDIAPAGMLPTIISHSKGVKCVLIRSNSSFHGPTTVLPTVKSPNRWSTTKSLPWEALLPCTTR